MYSQRMKLQALAVLKRNQMNIQRTIDELGYPRKSVLYQWSESLPRPKKEPKSKKLKRKPRFVTPQRLHPLIKPPKYCTIGQKLKAIDRCYKQGESPGKVAKEMGLSGGSVIYGWQRKYLEKGYVTSMRKESAKDSHLELAKQSSEIPETYDALKAEYEVLKAQKKAYLEERKRLIAERERIAMERDVLEKKIEILKKGLGVNPEAMSNLEKAVIVDALRNRYSRSVLREHVGLSRSSYYYVKTAVEVGDKHTDLRKEIRRIFDASDATYGSRRIWGELRNTGTRVSEKIVRRLMNEEVLYAICRKRRRYSSYQGEVSPAPENLIARNFHADKANYKWLTDITEFSIPAGKIFLSPIVDCYDGMVVAWNMSTKPDAKLVIRSLEEAMKKLNGETPIVHSDRGNHYRWPGWINLMTQNGLIRSMSKKGCSPDNAACEGFFGRLKNECFYDRSFKNTSVDAFMAYIDTYIQWYNTKRIKKSLGYLSPTEYRQKQLQAV